MLIPGDTQHHCDTSTKAGLDLGQLIDEALTHIQLTLGH